MLDVSLYAEAVGDIEVYDQETIDRLSGFHIWTDRMAEDRLKWKRKNPLHVILLRAYRLQPAAQVSVMPEYAGCKSWIALKEDLSGVPRVSAVAENEFQARIAEIKSALGTEPNV